MRVARRLAEFLRAPHVGRVPPVEVRLADGKGSHEGFIGRDRARHSRIARSKSRIDDSDAKRSRDENDTANDERGEQQFGGRRRRRCAKR